MSIDGFLEFTCVNTTLRFSPKSFTGIEYELLSPNLNATSESIWSESIHLILNKFKVHDNFW